MCKHKNPVVGLVWEALGDFAQTYILIKQMFKFLGCFLESQVIFFFTSPSDLDQTRTAWE